jgi:hypothetical protein
MSEAFSRRGEHIQIPSDSFVFWATLVQHLLVSSVVRTRVLWCFDQHDVCFGSSLLDAEVWQEQFGDLVSGQWRVLQDGRLTLLRQTDEALFPSQPQVPSWLARKLVSSAEDGASQSSLLKPRR